MKSIWKLFWLGASLFVLTASAQQIPDDPVVAPDARESADNNITFPVDI
jgi:hypothetical protein